MYSLNLPVSTLRTKMRQEFERHRYVKQLQTVDVLLFNSHQEYQVQTNKPSIAVSLLGSQTSPGLAIESSEGTNREHIG